MYSLIIMTAMATSGDTPDFNGKLLGMLRGGCQGNSCRGAVVVSGCHGSSCTGYSCNGSSCYGSSCNGSSCNGNSCRGGGLFGLRNAFRSNGCQGSSCHGSSCMGSSCMGSSCMGSYGSSVWGASCFGSGSVINNGCIGSGCFGSAPVIYSTPSNYVPGNVIPSSTPIYNPPMNNIIPPAAPIHNSTSYFEGQVVQVMPTIGTVKLESEEEDEANISIELPEGAKLYVDGHMINAESRKFHTPKLPKGKKFYYEMKAEMVVAGKAVTEEKTIIVKAGDKLTERFGTLYTAVASAK